MFNNFEISLVVFIPNITTNHAITYTKRSQLASGQKYSYSAAGLTYTDSLYVYVKNKAGKGFSLIR